MPRKKGKLLHLRQFPDYNLVERVAMGAYEFVDVLAEKEVANLGACVHAIGLGGCQCIPESYCPISSSATRCQESMLMRRPRKGLHSSYMLVELHYRIILVDAPDEKLVVISSGGQFLLIKRPF